MVTESEVTSESSQRIGRPSRFSDETMAYLATTYPEVHSRRGLVDIAYRYRAIGLVKDIPACHWLCDVEAMKRGDDDKCWQPSILTELGRIDDDNTLIAVAIQVCERQPSREDAIHLIRRYRTTPRPPQNDQLATEILGAINGYIRRYPGTTWPAVHDALDLVQVAVRGAQQDVEDRRT